MIEPWETVRSRIMADCRVFTVHEHVRIAPRTGREHAMYVVSASDWVNIVPLTDEGQVVLVRQYRHGTKDVTLEIPGGMVDPEDASPLHAARREMREETGYDSDDIVPLGCVAPNPAIQDNRCFTFLARGARRVAEPAPDGAEDIAVELVERMALEGLVGDGSITHSLVVAALFHLGQYEQRDREPGPIPEA